MITSTIQRAKNLKKDIYHTRMLQAIKKCGITFNIWQKSDEKGYTTGKYDWTSFMGTDKKKLLKSLPKHFPEYIFSPSLNTVTKIWQIYTHLIL